MNDFGKKNIGKNDSTFQGNFIRLISISLQSFVILVSNFLDVRKRFKRFSKNSLLLCHIIGGVFRLVGYLGYYIVKPKYIELQYRQSASSASFFTGITSVATMAIGTMVGGVLIRSLRPNARTIAVFVVLVEFLSSVAIFGGMFLQCPTPQFFGLEQMNPTINPYVIRIF